MTNNPFSLENKKILITGASSGIGQATAIECSKLGAQIVITGRNEERLNSTLNSLHGDGHIVMSADLNNNKSIGMLIDQSPQYDGIVLSVGKNIITPIIFSNRDKYFDIFNTNLFSQIELVRLLLSAKKIKNNASLVFVVSIGGTSNFSVGYSIYGASKAALKSYISYCALELSHKKIRVNGVCPGMVNTPMTHDSNLTQQQIDADIEKYPLKRYGSAEEISYGIIYLLSDASSWFTGQFLVIDGGRSLL